MLLLLLVRMYGVNRGDRPWERAKGRRAARVKKRKRNEEHVPWVDMNVSAMVVAIVVALIGVWLSMGILAESNR